MPVMKRQNLEFDFLLETDHGKTVIIQICVSCERNLEENEGISINKTLFPNRMKTLGASFTHHIPPRTDLWDSDCGAAMKVLSLDIYSLSSTGQAHSKTGRTTSL